MRTSGRLLKIFGTQRNFLGIRGRGSGDGRDVFFSAPTGGDLTTNGTAVNLTMHFDNIQTIKEAVALGSGISILPARTMQAEIAQGRLVAVKLHAPDLHRPVGVLHRRRKKFNAATQSFLDLLLAAEGA